MSGALITILFFCTIGAAFDYAVRSAETAAERFARRFLFGVGFIGVSGHLAGVMYIPLGVFWFAGLFVAAVVVISIRRRTRVAAAPTVQSSLVSKIAIGVAAIPIAVLLVDTATLPLRDYDGRVFWVLKARAIAHENSITGPFFDGTSSRHSHTQYPLMMPMAAAAVFELSGSDDDRTIRWVYSFTAIAFLLTLRRALRGVSDDTIASVIVSAVAWLPHFAADGDGGIPSGYSDIPLIAFTSLAFSLLMNREAESWMFPAAVAFIPLVKNEGIVVAFLVACIALSVIHAREGTPHMIRAGVRMAGLSLLVLITLSVWRAGIPLEYDENYPHLIQALGTKYVNIPAALGEFASRAFNLREWGVFWIFAVAAGMLALRLPRSREAIACSIASLLLLLVYATTYAVTNWNVADLAQVSANRLLLHFVPFAAVIGASCVKQLEGGQPRPPLTTQS